MPSVNDDDELSLQDERNNGCIVVLGEVLWDLFEGARRLGGAPLNFACHAKRLGHNPSLISAVGADPMGQEAAAAITALGLDTTYLQKTARFPTGTARVDLGPGERTRFLIDRPAAYDAIELSSADVDQLAQLAPAWLYHGTLFPSTTEGEAVLHCLGHALPAAARFYDLNLRPGGYSELLVTELLSQAAVVKLNEEELYAVHELTRLPLEFEAFCREGAARYGWRAVCVTLAARGCAMFVCGSYIESPGQVIEVVDPVGAGDAFAAAFLHGLVSAWPVERIAEFANRVGAVVASRPGAIPDWTLEEVGTE